MRKFGLFIILLAVISILTLISATAEDEPVTMPPEYGDFLSEIPQDIAKLLPDGLFADDLTSVYNASRELTDVEYLFWAILSAVGVCIKECAGVLLTLLAVTLAGVVLNHVGRSLNPAASTALGFCIRLVLFSVIAGSATVIVGDVEAYFDRLTGLTSAVVPIMGVLYALGGNLTSAAVNGEIMAVFLSVCQYINASTILPIFSLLLAFGLMSALSGTLRLNVISDMIKKWYVSFLGLIMTVLGIAMGLQSALAVKADGVSMKGLKYVISNAIPVVGGAISGSVSTLAAGVGLMRTTFGISAMVILILMLLPILVRLILYKQVFLIAAALSDIVSNGGEGRLLRDISGMYGFLLAAASIATVILILSLSLFSGTAVAYT
ncbi:MAG: hypothetical protein E7589_06085 [Ruminococcaceae bacterium]|nr:hypothetical protein [Oscillospiraceae bacterium]